MDGKPFIGGAKPSIADIRLAATLEPGRDAALNFCENKDLTNGDRQGIEGDRSSEGRQGGRPG